MFISNITPFANDNAQAIPIDFGSTCEAKIVIDNDTELKGLASSKKTNVTTAFNIVDMTP